MAELGWLTARPVAHRGLHDAQNGVFENTASAFLAAIAGNYGIECDLQISGDGEAMVFHDATLGHLTEGSGKVDEMSASALKRVAFRGTSDRIMTLGELCDLVAGRATLVIELKSFFDGDRRLPDRVAEVLAGYAGRAAVMSFDPAQVATLRDRAPALTRGIVAASRYDWVQASAATRRAMAYFAHAVRTRPQFIAYEVQDLPAAIPFLARKVFGLPVLTWTVRDAEDRLRAGRYADQMIFEGFRP
jgi:glycerophosphoryl diester phosphodiesterase